MFWGKNRGKYVTQMKKENNSKEKSGKLGP